MRIATWNVNSLPARIDKVWWWLERAAPDVLLLQETKIDDDAAPIAAFEEHGYKFAHHGEGRWNGVAIASRVGIEDVVTAFGGHEDEARMIGAVCNGVRVVSIYAPNGRTVDSTHYAEKLAWFERLDAWVGATLETEPSLVVGGDYNIAPTDVDVWDPAACNGGTHVSEPERAALARLTDRGLVDLYRKEHQETHRYSWWDYRAGAFHKNMGMRIDLMLGSPAVAKRVVGAEIDREARKGKPIPSDHTPVVIDLDEPGLAFDAKWARADNKRKRG